MIFNITTKNVIRLLLIITLFLTFFNYDALYIIILRFIKLFTCFITRDINLLDYNLMFFYTLNLKSLDLHSLRLIQRIIAVMFILINTLIFWMFFKFSFISFKNRFSLEEFKKNYIFFIVLFFILLVTIKEIFFFNTEGIFIHFDYPCLNKEFLNYLKHRNLNLKIVTNFYFIIIFLLFLLNKQESTAYKFILWYFLWFLIKSIENAGGVSYDVAFLLYQRENIQIELILSVFNSFPIFGNTFCMENGTQDPCKDLIEAIKNCLEIEKKQVVKNTFVKIFPSLKPYADMDTKAQMGECLSDYAKLINNCSNRNIK